MSTYQRPIRSDELYHNSMNKGRNNITYRIQQTNQEIMRLKEIIANPNPREKHYLDVYKRKLEELYDSKKKLHEQLNGFNSSRMAHSSDELMHWGRKGFHKYIAKIGNRYFYTPEEVEAYKLAQVKGGVENAQHTAEANKLHQKSKAQHAQAQKALDQSMQLQGQSNRKKVQSWVEPTRDRYKKTAKDSEKDAARAKFLEGRSQGLKRSSQANERIAQDHERQAQKALDDAKKQQENIVKDKSLLTQIAFKRAVEKEDREKKKKQQREAGKKKVQEWFRKKGWIY